MAPADRGTQRLVAGRGPALPARGRDLGRGSPLIECGREVGSVAGGAGQQPEAVVEPVQHLVHGQRPQPSGGQFQRERNAVEPVAELGDRRLVGRPDGEPGDDGGGAVGEQGGRIGGVHRRQRHGPLAVEPERPAARGQHLQPGGAAQQLPGQFGAGVDQVLVAVQDEQQVPVGEEVAQYGAHRAAAVAGGSQRLGDGVVQEVRFVQGGQFDQPHPIAEAILQDPCRLAGKPRLADAAEAGERHQPGGFQLPCQRGQFVVAADEAVELRGKIPRPVRLPQRRGGGTGSRAGAREASHGTRSVLGRMRTVQSRLGNPGPALRVPGGTGYGRTVTAR